MTLIHFFKIMKHWNPVIIGYWVIGASCLIEKGLERSPSPPNCSNSSWKLLLLLISFKWPSLDLMSCGSKIYSKMHPVLCANIYHDVRDLVNHGMVENTKTWISWKRNIIFLRNKKILNLCLKWHILRSYRFLAEVTFKYVIT